MKCDGKFNGGYIKATEEVYNLLTSLGYVAEKPYNTNSDCYWTAQDKIIPCGFYYITEEIGCHEFYINNGELSWEDPTSIENQDECEATVKQIISIKDDDGKEYVFEKPDFECELLGVRKGKIIGWIKTPKDGYVWAIAWAFDGSCDYSDFYINPITPKWYEDTDNFPALIAHDDHPLSMCSNKDSYLNDVRNSWRLATKAERDSLHCKGD